MKDELNQQLLNKQLVGAAEIGDFDGVKSALGYGAEINIRDDLNRTALMWATSYCYIDIVRLLLEREADISASNGATVLMIAAENGNTEILDMLLDNGADIEHKDSYGYTALMYAAWNGKVDALRLLLDRGANIEANDNLFATALIYAARCDRVETVQLLLERGAKFEVKDRFGSTALMAAQEKQNHDVISILSSYTANQLLSSVISAESSERKGLSF